jgi:bifunctional oligoribonuclease and PAP phosphatase NrnA
MKVTNKVSLKELAIALRRQERLVLLTHISPDVDGLGSLLSLARALESEGKQVIRFVPEGLPTRIPMLRDFDKITSQVDWSAESAVVALDCGEIKRTGVAQKLAGLPAPIINIDHHPQSDPFGNIAFVDEHKTSTAEIVFLLLQEMQIDINKEIADMLLAGIVCDTQGFQVASTSAEVLEIAAQLMRHGARMPVITKNLFRVKPLLALKLWGRVLDRVIIDKDSQLAYSVVRQSDFQELRATPQDLEGVIDLINSVSEASFSMLLSEDGDNIVKGSLRSEEFKKIDVSKIAQLFGGGGHKLASGFRLNGRLKQKAGRWVIEKRIEA